MSALVPYKRIDLAIRAFNILQKRLYVVGTGPEEKRLKKMAGSTIRFLGWAEGQRLARLYARSLAFVMPGEEDFGIAPVEAMAVGRPVIAYGGGGALDTVLPGVTGELFTEQTVESLGDIVARFDASCYDSVACRAQAERFSVERFREKLIGYIDQLGV